MRDAANVLIGGDIDFARSNQGVDRLLPFRRGRQLVDHAEIVDLLLDQAGKQLAFAVILPQPADRALDLPGGIVGAVTPELVLQLVEAIEA
ncbi:hypothetical protein D3C79_1059000 [compost metagenome]